MTNEEMVLLPLAGPLLLPPPPLRMPPLVPLLLMMLAVDSVFEARFGTGGGTAAAVAISE